MKKGKFSINLINIGLFLVVISTFFSCKTTDKYKEISYKEKLEYFDCDVAYPDFEKYPEIGKALKERYETEINKMKPDAKDDYDERAREGFPSMPHEYEFFMGNVYSDKNIINFVMTTYEFCGGAHGNTSFESFYFDKNQKRFLTHEEILKYLGITEEVLSEMVRKELKNPESNAYEEWQERLSCSDENWILSGTEPNFHCFDTIFYNGKTKMIEIIIPAYQIAPYSGGTFFIDLQLKNK